MRRSSKSWSVLAVAGLWTLGCATSGGIREAELPRYFVGVFQWRGDAPPSNVVLEIDKVEVAGDVIRFKGGNTYETSDLRLEVEGTINRKDYSVTIRELPSDQPGAVTDGLFRGSISRNLQAITAEWRPTTTGQEGTLVLTAAEGRPDGPRSENPLPASKTFPELLEELDGKGLFPLSPERAASLRVRRVVAHDWLHRDGKLTDRKAESVVEYDQEGHMTRFAGYVDQTGFVDMERAWSGGELIEDRIYGETTPGGERPLLGRATYEYPESGIREKVILDPEGEVLGKTRYIEDESGRLVRREGEGEGGEVSVMTRAYDAWGNPVEDESPTGRSLFSYDGQAVTVYHFLGHSVDRNLLGSTYAYTFDGSGNLIAYRREGGGFWDSFKYKYDERGLPIEKTWSRFEYVLQEPYQTTRYSYELW
ncbi:MAG TPA: hypothetical protein VF017_18785 [Thermoanaerobaculia bacterium]|nr:hypothetical protein [Thermoanaerobaculia bacterium]